MPATDLSSLTDEQLSERLSGALADIQSGECVLVDDAFSTFSWCGRPATETFDDTDALMAAVRQTCDERGFWPSVYMVNDHGNVTLLDLQGNEIVSWV